MHYITCKEQKKGFKITNNYVMYSFVISTDTRNFNFITIIAECYTMPLPTICWDCIFVFRLFLICKLTTLAVTIVSSYSI